MCPVMNTYGDTITAGITICLPLNACNVLTIGIANMAGHLLTTYHIITCSDNYNDYFTMTNLESCLELPNGLLQMLQPWPKDQDCQVKRFATYIERLSDWDDLRRSRPEAICNNAL